jgi:hypothetical protein
MITLGSLLKITKVLQIVRLLFFYDKRRVIILTKKKENVVGYLMGHFLTNSSGHPAAAAMARSKVFGFFICLQHTNKLRCSKPS